MLRGLTAVAASLLVSVTLSTGSAQQPSIPRDPRPQPARPGTAVIKGRVIDAVTGQPIPRAVVIAQLRGGNASAVTDVDGTFQLVELPAGEYTITAQKVLYQQGAYGSKGPRGRAQPVKVADGQIVENLDIRLMRNGVIAGRVVDGHGEPVPGARIEALRYRYMSGARRLQATGTSQSTDDLGGYRIYNLPPGDYYVRAKAPRTTFGADLSVAYAATFFPSTANAAEAQRVTVSAGQDAVAIDIIAIAARAANLRGIALDARNQPFAGASLYLVQRTRVEMTSRMSGQVSPDGRFTIYEVGPGDYVLEVRHSSGFSSTGEDKEVAWTHVTVDGRDIDGLVLAAQPPGRISGRLIFEDGVPPPDAAKRYDVYTEPADERTPGLNRPTQSNTRQDLTFDIGGLWGPQYVMFRTFGFGGPSSSQPWVLKAMRHGGRDVTGLPLEVESGKIVKDVEVVLTTRISKITGSVTDRQGNAADEASILIFSEDRARWRDRPFLILAILDRKGRFDSAAIPPHDYVAIALARFEGELAEGAWHDPEFLESLRRHATRVSLTHGETREVTLRIVELPGGR